MSKQELFYIEPFMRGVQHAPFNAAMLQVVQRIYPKATIQLWCSNDHFLAIKEQSPLSLQIVHRTLNIPALLQANKTRWVYKHLMECWLLTKLLIQAKRKKVDLVYFSFLSPPAQWLLSRYRTFFFKKLSIVVQLHGLSLLKATKQMKSTDRIYARLLRGAFRWKTSFLYYIVLEKGAQRYLQQQQLIPTSHLIYIPHPYIFKKHAIRQKKEGVLTLVHLGVARLSKGSSQFFELAYRFKEEIKRHQVVFKVIGRVLPEMDNYLNTYVVYPKNKEMLSVAEYQEALNGADYALFCYDSDNYELTSSGSLMDAIAAYKPILALRNPSFSELFSIVPHPPGQLFADLTEMEAYIRSMLDLQLRTNEATESAFMVLQTHFGIDNVAKELNEHLKRIVC
ncbi:hypothetical protein RYH73_06075 [Olivibacter sp. CPCC 100613]|uniref:hypothetical protein n=1 Tax=Olivibacter sp. CPCC 100613 TaxID=3079931 RepID=UPI002FF83D02